MRFCPDRNHAKNRKTKKCVDQKEAREEAFGCLEKEGRQRDERQDYCPP